MPNDVTVHAGGCHCGNLAVRFETGLRPADLPVRACQCSFCRRHGARCVSDPGGRASITARDEGALVRYRFGLNTADFLVCGVCGVYLGALMSEDDGRAFATLNVNAFDKNGVFADATPVSYDAETEPARRERRRLKWTPAELHIGHRSGVNPLISDDSTCAESSSRGDRRPSRSPA